MPYKDKGGVIDFVGEGSCSFDGSNDYVSVADSTSLDAIAGTAYYTISAWVQADADITDTVTILTKYDNSHEGFVLDITGTNQLRWWTGDGSATDQTKTGTDTYSTTIGTWNHVAVTGGGGGVAKLYINGIEQDLTASGGASGTHNTIVVNNEPLTIGIYRGGSTNTYPWSGNIKNVAIWERALTATEVQNVMYKTYYEVYGRLASGLVSWWTLEKALTGTTTKDVHGSNNGTLGDGLTAGTYPTFTSNIYGGAVPVKPRAVDNSPKVQADAIGSGSALFDASDESIDIGSKSAFTSFSALNSGSITAWIKLTDYTSAGNQAIIGNNGGAGGSRGFVFYYYGTDDNLRLHLTGGSDVDITSGGDASIADNEWHHVAVVRTSAPTTSFYVDGVLTHSNETAQTSESGDSSQILQIGCSGVDTMDFAGNICQVGYWVGALTQEKIQSVMEKTYEELTATEKSSLGSEEVTNNSFDDGETGYNTIGSEWTLSGGTASFSHTGSQTFQTATDDYTSGKLYKTVMDIASISNCDVRVLRAGTDVMASEVGTAGIHTTYAVTTGNGVAKISIENVSGTGTCVLNSISVKEVTHDLVSYWALDEALEEGRSPVESNARTETGVQTGAGSIVLDSVNPPTYTEILSSTTFATQGDWVMASGSFEWGNTDVYPEGALMIDSAGYTHLDTGSSGFSTSLVTGSIYKIEFVMTVIDTSHVQNFWFGIDSSYGAYGLWRRYMYNTDVLPEAEQTVTFYHRHDGGGYFYFRNGSSSTEIHIKSVSCKLVSGNQGQLI